VLGAQEQYIIANVEKIPVIGINPKPANFGGGLVLQVDIYYVVNMNNF